MCGWCDTGCQPLGIFEKRFEVPRAYAQDDRNAPGDRFGDQSPKTAPFGLVLAEFVDDQDIRGPGELVLGGRYGLFQRRRVQAAAARAGCMRSRKAST